MKKILFAAMAALAITSCSQNEEIDTLAQKAEINFNTVVSKTSRAVTTTTDQFNNFKVYAYTHSTAFDETTTGNAIIDGVVFDKSENTWSAEGDKKFYWPVSDMVSFFAYSPKKSSVTFDHTTAGAPTLTYSVAEAPTDQEDLVVAQKVDQKKSENGATGAVSLTFKHALTKLAFKVRGLGDGITYTVTKITVNAKGGGTYTYDMTNDVLGNWTADATNAVYTVYDTNETALTFEGSDKTPAAANIKDLTAADKTLMLIPQSGATVKVTYSAAYTNGSTIRTSAEETIAIADTWTAGQNIIYTLVLKPGEAMDITGTLADNWDTVISNDANMN